MFSLRSIALLLAASTALSFTSAAPVEAVEVASANLEKRAVSFVGCNADQTSKLQDSLDSQSFTPCTNVSLLTVPL
jgi:hypothetical protein